MSIKNLSLSFILLFSIATIALSVDEEGCVYTFYVRTGSINLAGTDSIISVRLHDANGKEVEITNLEAWGGLMGPDYDYFERGNLDIFSGRRQCLDLSVCAITLTSDGSGPHPGWYCDYVEVTSTGVDKACEKQQFVIDQWLAIDSPPYELTTTRNYCPSDVDDQSVRAYRDGKVTEKSAYLSGAIRSVINV